MTKRRFPGKERLKQRTQIEILFQLGEAIYVYPIRLVFKEEVKNSSSDYPVQVAFNVPKRKIKGAVDRNLIKRRMKEAYRLNRQKLLLQNLNKEDKVISVAFVYQHHEILSYSTIEKSIKKLLTRLNQVATDA